MSCEGAAHHIAYAGDADPTNCVRRTTSEQS
jgi:hypothetical protein